MRWLFLLLLASGGIRAAEVQFDQIAQDGQRVWASSVTKRGQIAQRNGANWDAVEVVELRDLAPIRLLALRDGSLACLWKSDDEKTRAVSWHRAEKESACFRFSAKLKEPLLLELRDGSIVITESGPTVIQVRPDAGARVMTIPEKLFLPPKKKNESGDVNYAPVRALEDGAARVILWSFAFDPS